MTKRMGNSLRKCSSHAPNVPWSWKNTPVRRLLEGCSDLSSIFADAVSDSVNAIQLDENNTKAYLRQGTALYHQDQKEEALKAFKRGLEIEGKNWFIEMKDSAFVRGSLQLATINWKCGKKNVKRTSQVDEWDFFEAEITVCLSREKTGRCSGTSRSSHSSSSSKDQVCLSITLITFQPSLILTRHSFYQSDSAVTIQIPIKGLKKEQVQVDTTDTTVRDTTGVCINWIVLSVLLAQCHDEDSSDRCWLFPGIQSGLSDRFVTHEFQRHRFKCK